MAIATEEITKLLAEHRNGSQYTDDIKLETVSNFIVLGSLRKTAELMNIPYNTVQMWSKLDWWEAITNQIREQKQQEIDAKLENIVLSGLDEVSDRLSNGEIVIDKENNELRVPVKLRDAAWSTGVFYDKLRIHRNQPTNITNNISNDQLLDLKAQFEQLAGSVEAKIINNETD